MTVDEAVSEFFNHDVSTFFSAGLLVVDALVTVDDVAESFLIHELAGLVEEVLTADLEAIETSDLEASSFLIQLFAGFLIV